VGAGVVVHAESNAPVLITALDLRRNFLLSIGLRVYVEKNKKRGRVN
jgi:hypothetical protein